MEEKERYKYFGGSRKIDECIFIDGQSGGYIDNLGEACDLLNQQDKRIKELQEKLSSVYDVTNESLRFARDSLQKLVNENQQLKQQLHDLPKKIVEEITNELSNNTSLYFEIRESTSAHCPNKEYEWFNYVRFRNYINTILKKYGEGK